MLLFISNSPASNVYRYSGDILHVVAIIILLIRFYVKKNSNGISGKTQLLLALTYTARYSDLWGNLIFISYYHACMKIFYICVSFFLVYLTVHTFKESYNKEHDSFRIELLIFPVTLMALTINHSTSWLEISWTWSIYMEAVALVPQLYMIWKSKSKNSDSYIILYLLFMTIYKGMYICNWVYRYNEEGYFDSIAFIGGIVQSCIGVIGVLCVISQSLSHMSSPASYTNGVNNYEKSDSIFVIPLLFSDELKSKADVVIGTTSNLPQQA